MPLAYNTSWLSGFFCGDGCFNLNRNNLQANITIGQKEEKILQNIKKVYGGNVYLDISSNCYVWQSSNVDNLVKLINYFIDNPLNNKYKQNKLNSFKLYVDSLIQNRGKWTPELKEEMIKHIDEFQLIKD